MPSPRSFEPSKLAFASSKLQSFGNSYKVLENSLLERVGVLSAELQGHNAIARAAEDTIAAARVQIDHLQTELQELKGSIAKLEDRSRHPNGLIWSTFAAQALVAIADRVVGARGGTERS